MTEIKENTNRALAERDAVLCDFLYPRVKIFVLPGGTKPSIKSDDAIGYDAAIRAIVSNTEMDSEIPRLRKNLFDFKSPPGDPGVSARVHQLGDKLVYRLNPGDRATVGIGFATQMPAGVFYWMAPRSGLASRWGITVENAPGTVDPDYRGEAGAIICNRSKDPFDLEKGMRVVQVIFQRALFPAFYEVGKLEELDSTERGSGGFGSTGLMS